MASRNFPSSVSLCCCVVSRFCTCVCVSYLPSVHVSMWESVCSMWCDGQQHERCCFLLCKKRLCDCTLCVAVLLGCWISGMPRWVGTCPRKCQRTINNTAKHTHNLFPSLSLFLLFPVCIFSHYPFLLPFACGKTAVSIRPWGPWHGSHAKNPLRSWQRSSSSSCLCREELCRGSLMTLIQTVNNPFFSVIKKTLSVIFCHKVEMFTILKVYLDCIYWCHIFYFI